MAALDVARCLVTKLNSVLQELSDLEDRGRQRAFSGGSHAGSLTPACEKGILSLLQRSVSSDTSGRMALQSSDQGAINAGAMEDLSPNREGLLTVADLVSAKSVSHRARHLRALSSHAAAALSTLALNPDQHFGLVGVGAVPAMVRLINCAGEFFSSLHMTISEFLL